jgi:hypothetical protein
LNLHGTQFGDFAWNGGRIDFLASDRFARSFAQEGMSGIETVDEVGVIDRPEGAPLYVRVRLARSQVTVDEVRSGIVRTGPIRCDDCRLSGVSRIARVLIDEQSWSGEDLFIPRGLANFPMASARFKEFLVRHQFSNLLLVPSEEYTSDFGVTKS